MEKNKKQMGIVIISVYLRRRLVNQRLPSSKFIEVLFSPQVMGASLNEQWPMNKKQGSPKALIRGHCNRLRCPLCERLLPAGRRDALHPE